MVASSSAGRGTYAAGTPGGEKAGEFGDDHRGDGRGHEFQRARPRMGRRRGQLVGDQATHSVLLREGITRLLAEGGIEVVAGVGDAEALEMAVEREQPDLAIVDVRMPPTHRDEGLRAAIRDPSPLAQGRTPRPVPGRGRAVRQ